MPRQDHHFNPEVAHDLGRFMDRQPGEPTLIPLTPDQRLAEIEQSRYRIEDDPREIERAAKILAALDAGETGIFGITRALHPHWTYDDVDTVMGTLGRLVTAGKVRVSGVTYTKAPTCGNEYTAGGIPYSCKREAGHTGNHTCSGGDFRWMNEG